MKTQTLYLMVSISLFPTYVMSNEGKVYFNGALSTDSCSISTSDSNQTINLGSVPTAIFHAAGDKSAAVAFTVNMTNCPESLSSVQLKFDGKSDQNNTDLLSLESDSSAAFVGIGIEEADGTLLPVHMASKPVDIDKNSHSVQMFYQARYVATSERVSPGDANGVSQFSVNYN